MKKYPLLASTLIVATALAVPAFADDEEIALLATDGIMPLATTLTADGGTNNTTGSMIGGSIYGTVDVKSINGGTFNLTGTGTADFKSGSSLLVDATSTLNSEGSIKFEDGSEITLYVGATATTTNVNVTSNVYISDSCSVTIYVDVSSLSDDTTEFTIGLITGGSWTFDDDTTASDLNLTAKFMNGDEEDTSWDYSVVLNEGTLSLIVSQSAAVPEPSMFGMILGLGAIGLVATRRRKRA